MFYFLFFVEGIIYQWEKNTNEFTYVCFYIKMKQYNCKGINYMVIIRTVIPEYMLHNYICLKDSPISNQKNELFNFISEQYAVEKKPTV